MSVCVDCFGREEEDVRGGECEWLRGRGVVVLLTSQLA